MTTIEQPTLALEAKPNGQGGQPFAIEAITYPVLASRIGELAAEFMVLRVASVNDMEGLIKVHDARMTVKGLRVSVEKRRKELKAGALEYGRHVDTAAKQLTDLLEPIETHLTTQEEIVTKEKERLAKLEADRLAQRTQERLKQLADCEAMLDPALVAIMPDNQFLEILNAKQFEHAERKRLAAIEAAERQAEAERIAADRAELARLRAEQEATVLAERQRLAIIRAEQEAAQAKIDAEKKQLAEAEAARIRAEELERARQEAAERARVETEQRLAREKEQAEIETKAAEAARIKAEALRPDKVKLLSVADAVSRIEIPSVSSDASGARAGVVRVLDEAVKKIRKLAEELGGCDRE